MPATVFCQRTGYIFTLDTSACERSQSTGTGSVSDGSLLTDAAISLAYEDSPLADEVPSFGPYLFLLFLVSLLFAYCPQGEYYHQNEREKLLFLRFYVALLNYPLK